MFQNSFLAEARKDKNNDPNTVSIKRFVAPAKLASGAETSVRITVKETKIEGHRIYSIELMEINKAPFAGKDALGGTVGKTNATAGTGKPAPKARNL